MPQILHVVLARWRPAAQDRAEQDPAARAQALLDAHLPEVAGIVSVDAGASVSPEGLEQGNDWMLVIRFSDRAALEAYLPHPAHRPIADFLGGAAERVTVFDIES